MKLPLSHVLSGVALWLLKRYRSASLDLLRIEAAACYVRGVAAARLVFLGELALVLLVVVAAVGFVLLHIGLYALLPSPANGVTLLALGAFYLAVALLALRWLCSSKTWMKYSQADRLVKQATGKGQPES